MSKRLSIVHEKGKTKRKFIAAVVVIATAIFTYTTLKILSNNTININSNNTTNNYNNSNNTNDYNITNNFNNTNSNVPLRLTAKLDGIDLPSIAGCGTVDVYINDKPAKKYCTEYDELYPVTTSYEIKNIQPNPGFSYDGMDTNMTKGVLGEDGVNVVLYFSTIATDNLPEQTTQGTFNGHTYMFFNEQVTYYTAKKYCEQLEGHLATVSSAEENEFLLSLCEGNAAWLGGTDFRQEGVWRWITDEPFSYTAWKPGQPDNWGEDQGANEEGSENYLYIADESGWNDNPGCFKHGFICEKDT